ncbi:MAG TPA: multidrug efflux RND transporter permease subunit, partial [Tepidisphaeraceae bacterium]|nr:multidrug efflux RND transporter permease subunit [Tepidisphaeraceae bacterium]
GRRGQAVNIARFFIDRPVFAAVLSIVTVVAGAIAAFALPVAQYPPIAPPTVTVVTNYPGANAQTVAQTVATPIEAQVNGVEKMLYLSSQSTNDGTMRMTVTFEVGTNLDIAQVQVQNRVAIALPQLPSDVQRNGVTVRKASPDITLVVQLYSPDKSLDALFMSNYATLQIRDEIARLPGVGDINVFGAREYSMRLWIDPNKAAARAITATDIVTALREQNVQVAAGVVGGPPLPAGATQFQYTVNTTGRLTTPEEFADVIVKVGQDGRITRIRDVGRVELGAADYTTGNTYNGTPAVGMGIFQLPGSNAIQTATAVVARMEELKRNFPKGLDYATPYNTTLFVQESIRDVIKTLLEAVGLVVIVVLVFLQNWRSAVIPLLAIPVSLIGTFAVMWAFGFSLNMLTLFGMVLAIGIVVDDAIVVVENVERWIAEGYSPRDAAYRAMDEVTPAVIAIAFGLSAVFIPVAFISGITGQFYRQFALTIAFSTLLSAFNSLTLSPALAAVMLQPHGAKRDWLNRLLGTTLGWFFRAFNRGLERMNAGYARVLHRVVRLAVLALLVYGGLLALTYFGFRSVPTGFIPNQDQGYLLVNLQMPDASAIERTRATIDRLTELALKTEGIRDVVGIPGFSLLTGSSSSSAGTMFVILAPFEERAGKAELSQQAIVGRLNGAYAQVQEGLPLVITPPPVRGIGAAGGFRMQVQDRSGTASPQELQAQVGRLIAEAQKRPELVNLFSSFRASVPQLFADVDRTRAKQANVAVTDIFTTLQTYLGSLYVNDFNYLGRTYRVIAQADAPFRATAGDVSQFQTRNADGEMVPLGSVMDLKDVSGPDRINRYNLYTSAEITGAGAPGISTGQALEIMEGLARDVLPQGYGFEWTEIAYQERLAGNTALFIFPLCIFFVWLTHSAEYESFSLSTAIILIVPMCLLCGIYAVWAWGSDNNIFTQIGFVVLAGMSVKNAVLIVEFAKQQQEHHPNLSASDAVIEASRLRLRPILMTSIAFIMGVLPLIIAKGAGAEMRQALGVVVFFGMAGVTIFGLFLTPVFYVAIRWVTGHFVRPPADEPRHAPPEGPARAGAPTAPEAPPG